MIKIIARIKQLILLRLRDKYYIKEGGRKWKMYK